MKCGKIIVITGPMKSGKSEEIIRRIQRFKIANKPVLLFKPDVDKRFSEGEIVSRNEKSLECTTIPVYNPEYILSLVTDMLEVIVIDEAQFFESDETDLGNICTVVEYLSNKGHTVIIAGLDMDSDGHPFGPMPFLMALADEVIKLKSVCEKCGCDDASMTVANIPKKEQKLIGDKEYNAYCRTCAFKQRVK